MLSGLSYQSGREATQNRHVCEDVSNSKSNGHLVSMVELARLLTTRNEALSVTILIIKFPLDTGISLYVEALENKGNPRFTILHVPPANYDGFEFLNYNTMLSSVIESHVRNVKNLVFHMTQPDHSTRLAGFVIDMFCASMIDVAKELNVPTYVYLTSGAGFLGILLHLQAMRDDHNQDVIEYKNSDAKLSVPYFRNQVPAKVLPSILLDKNGGSDLMLSCAQKFRETKGLIVNTFVELETYAVKSLMADSKVPPVYAVGPNLNLTGGGQNSDEAKDILNWLDEKPDSSVLFLCFGSFGSFPHDQVKEIAHALEHSGHPFLWSLHQGAGEGDPNKLTNSDDILPAGFLKRTSGTGKVIGWAHQVAVLSHRAVGGFISHCGWNSILESVWFGVPVATWPLYAEQQLNAFEMVNELEMAVQIAIDYENHVHVKSEIIIEAEIIEKKIREVMEEESEARKKVKEIKGKCREAMAKNGSSYNNLGRLIDDIVATSNDV